MNCKHCRMEYLAKLGERTERIINKWRIAPRNKDGRIENKSVAAAAWDEVEAVEKEMRSATSEDRQDPRHGEDEP